MIISPTLGLLECKPVHFFPVRQKVDNEVAENV